MSATTTKKKLPKPRANGVLPEWDEVVDRLRAGRPLHAGHLASIRGCTRERIIDLKCAEKLCTPGPKSVFLDCDIRHSAKSLWWSAPLVFRLFPEMRAIIQGGGSAR